MIYLMLDDQHRLLHFLRTTGWPKTDKVYLNSKLSVFRCNNVYLQLFYIAKLENVQCISKLWVTKDNSETVKATL